MKQTRSFCLASASPRRRELLEHCGFKFNVVPANVDERAHRGESPERIVSRLAQEKALAVQAPPGALVIAGDTVVEVMGEILGKPADAAAGCAMLRLLSGRTHRVLSGYCLREMGGQSLTRCQETQVTFRELPESWIEWYGTQDEMLDKAGAYGIQGLGGLMVSYIEGSYTNVMGFPVEAIVWDLIQHGWVTL